MQYVLQRRELLRVYKLRALRLSQRCQRRREEAAEAMGPPLASQTGHECDVDRQGRRRGRTCAPTTAAVGLYLDLGSDGLTRDAHPSMLEGLGSARAVRFEKHAAWRQRRRNRTRVRHVCVEQPARAAAAAAARLSACGRVAKRSQPHLGRH